MAHKSGTQANSEDMPKPDHLTLRGRVYYFRKRYPTHLRKAGIAPSKEIKKSLGTSDLKEATRLAVFELAQFHREVDSLEKQHGLKSELHDRAKESNRPLAFSSLSKREQRNLILSWFVELEAKAERSREHFRENRDEEAQKEFRETAREDLAAVEGTGPFSPVQWVQSFKSFLEPQGLKFDQEEADNEQLGLFKKAVIESQWRTLESFEGREYSHRDPAFTELHAASSVSQPAPKTRTIAELCEEYREAKLAAGRSPATMKAYNARFDAMQAALGADTNLASFDDQHGGDAYGAGKKLVSFLASIPPYAKSRYKDCPLAEACRLEAAKPNPQIIEPKTQRDYFTDIKAIFGFAVKRHWISRNPMDGLDDSLPKVRESPRAMLSGAELTTLLSSPEFLQERKRVTKGQRAEGRFWCVVLCLFHGMRLNEAASLLVSDVKKEDGIWFLDLTELDDEGLTVKRLKNKSSRRRVPVHKNAIKIGFLDFVQHRYEEGGEDWLFPDLKPNSIGNRGTYTSRWFARLRDKLIGKQKRTGDKGIHSLRHSVADAIRAVTDSDEILFAIGGWSSEQGGNSSRRYGKGDLKRLKRVIDQVEHESFDPSCLYPDNDPN